uniref:ELMO domain-containing protein n=1 Tax=Ciona savignyi TaxID=51511 RepID=H2YA57_CIOSA
QNFNNPVLDFDQTPPGVLSLDLMVYFARNQQDNYVRLVLENSSRDDKHECPFGKTTIHITKMLCEILKIGEQPTETGQDFYPMFFTHDSAFEEFYCICVQLFNKTWKEMSAIKDDFDKVGYVVHDQIVLALDNKPSSLDSFKQKLQSLSYAEILKKRQQERADREKFDSQALPVVELQKKIKPDIIELVRQQRFNFLISGTAFHKISNKRLRDKSRWYCRLSPNHKFLHYGDIDDTMVCPHIEALPEKLAITDVRDLVTGKNCPHIKNVRTHKMTTELAFSILFDPDDSLNFIAPDKETWSLWSDGINALLGKPMVSARATTDVDMLLTMEMKLRLLDLENIPIPDQPPPIPPLPKNYNFTLTA